MASICIRIRPPDGKSRLADRLPAALGITSPPRQASLCSTDQTGDVRSVLLAMRPSMIDFFIKLSSVHRTERGVWPPFEAVAYADGRASCPFSEQRLQRLYLDPEVLRYPIKALECPSKVTTMRASTWQVIRELLRQGVNLEPQLHVHCNTWSRYIHLLSIDCHGDSLWSSSCSIAMGIPQDVQQTQAHRLRIYNETRL